MKTYSFALLLILMTCPALTSIVGDTQLANGIIIPEELFKQLEAEQIMGEPMHLSDSITSLEEGVQKYRCGFMADKVGHQGGRAGAVYFLFEQFNSPGDAENKYRSIKKANEWGGLETLPNLGDEAYFHTDKENFYFIMVRKGNRVFNMKVNKISSTTSLEEFRRIAQRIASEI